MAPELAGLRASIKDVKDLEKAVKQAIITFEPRILKNTLRVTIDRRAQQYNNTALVFRIEGQMWAQPMPLNLNLRTEVDLETGSVELKEGAR